MMKGFTKKLLVTFIILAITCSVISDGDQEHHSTNGHVRRHHHHKSRYGRVVDQSQKSSTIFFAQEVYDSDPSQSYDRGSKIEGKCTKNEENVSIETRNNGNKSSIGGKPPSKTKNKDEKRPKKKHRKKKPRHKKFRYVKYKNDEKILIERNPENKNFNQNKTEVPAKKIAKNIQSRNEQKRRAEKTLKNEIAASSHSSVENLMHFNQRFNYQQLNNDTLNQSQGANALNETFEIISANDVRNDDPGNNAISTPQWSAQYPGVPSEQALNNSIITVTTSVGGSAFLPCKIGHLGDRQLSWIRRRDWHVVASGKTLYTHDPRFHILHEAGSQEWVLLIKSASLRDIGRYECHVSMGSGIISIFVDLNVVVPEAIISGPEQHHFDSGSHISLTCYINNSPIVLQYILWHHNGQLLNYRRDNSNIVIKDNLGRSNDRLELTEELLVNITYTDEENLYVSQLQIENANDKSSGNYSCSAPNTTPTWALVFITKAEKTAAIQRIHSKAAAEPKQINGPLDGLLLLLLAFCF